MTPRSDRDLGSLVRTITIILLTIFAWSADPPKCAAQSKLKLGDRHTGDLSGDPKRLERFTIDMKGGEKLTVVAKSRPPQRILIRLFDRRGQQITMSPLGGGGQGVGLNPASIEDVVMPYSGLYRLEVIGSVVDADYTLEISGVRTDGTIVTPSNTNNQLPPDNEVAALRKRVEELERRIEEQNRRIEELERGMRGRDRRG